MVAEPITGEEILADDHCAADHDGVGDAQIVVTGQTVAAEDGTADNGLEQIVGKTHTSEDAEMMEHTAHAIEGIPGRNHSRDDHQQDDEVVDGLKPWIEIAEFDKTQRDDNDGRANEDDVPYLQISSLIIEKSLPS